jgi:hypothetical protein
LSPVTAAYNCPDGTPQSTNTINPDSKTVDIYFKMGELPIRGVSGLNPPPLKTLGTVEAEMSVP